MMNMNSQTTPHWMWWWFRFGVGLAAALAGAALAAFLIWRLVKLGRWMRLPKEVRKKAAKEHLLSQVSGRGRTAYLILCLENALTHFNQPAADWEWVLQRLWALTEAPESQHQRLFEVCCFLPENVLPYERYEDLKTHGLSPELLALWDAEEGLPEERFQPLWDLYTGAGWRLCLLDPLMTAIYRLAALCWTDRSDQRRGLEMVEEAEHLMQNWSVPLPRGASLTAIQKERHAGWGPAFPGVRLSSVLRVRTPEEIEAELKKAAALETAEKPDAE